jgi:hypothetical protein
MVGLFDIPITLFEYFKTVHSRFKAATTIDHPGDLFLWQKQFHTGTWFADILTNRA